MNKGVTVLETTGRYLEKIDDGIYSLSMAMPHQLIPFQMRMDFTG